MTRYDRNQLIQFVRALDRHLTSKTSLLIVGGAAVSLGYHSITKTNDIDVMRVLEGDPNVGAAVRNAQDETGLAVAVAPATVTELPYDFEERLKPVSGLRLKKLTLYVPDKYDLSLSKTMRGYQHDLDAVESLNNQHPMSMKVLVQRFESELMKEAIADQKKICLNVVMLVSRLYGLSAAKELALRWDVPVPKRT